jgi:hypothetical protein
MSKVYSLTLLAALALPRYVRNRKNPSGTPHRQPVTHPIVLRRRDGDSVWDAASPGVASPTSVRIRRGGYGEIRDPQGWSTASRNPSTSPKSHSPVFYMPEGQVDSRKSDVDKGAEESDEGEETEEAHGVLDYV